MERSERVVLRDVSFEVPRGCTVLMGPNGSGKTTVCRAILGDLSMTHGEVLHDGSAVRSKADWHRFRGGLGWLPQSFGAPSRASVSNILRYAGWLKDIEVDVVQSLRDVGLDEAKDRRFGQLSGGQMRRVGIACALVGDPHGVLMDEPTVGLDPAQRDSFHQLMRTLTESMSVLISTHLLEDVAVLAQHVVVLHDGRVRFEGSPADLAGRRAPDLDALRAGYLRAVA